MNISFFRQPLVRDSALFLMALLVLLFAFRTLEPSYSNEKFRYSEAEEWNEYSHPFVETTPEMVFPELKFSMNIGVIKPSKFVLIPDDCIEEMTINGRPFSGDLLPICDFWFGETVDLSSYLIKGENTFHVIIKNDGGLSKLKIFIAHSDLALIILRLVLLLSFCLYSWSIIRRLSKSKADYLLYGTFFFSIFVRIYYFFITRYEVRAHDSEGHFEYIEYLLHNGFSLPLSTQGWEFYHPPLYYYLSAFLLKVDMLFTDLRHVLARDTQILSFLISVGMLVLIFCIGKQLFPKRNQIMQRVVFFLLVSLQPSFVFFSARINNDVLYQFFAFALFALILAWWKNPKTKYWFICIFALGLGMLSKSNALLLLPIIYACLLLHKKVAWKRKVQLGASGLIIIACMTGWFYALRFMVEDNTSIVQNLTNLNVGLSVDSSLETLTEFNPIRMIKIPFNNSWTTESGRDHFWEYWMRSAFFGEFPYKDSAVPLGSFVIFLAFMLIPFAVLGFIFCMRSKWYGTFPIWMTAAVVALGHAAYRQYAPYSPSQDFRYSILFLIPFVYFLIIGVGKRSKRIRIVLYSIISLLLIANLVFLFGLPIFEM